MDPSQATSFGSMSSKEHHLPKKQSSIHAHCSQPDAHSLQEHLGKQCHVDQLKGKDNTCSTLATQASHTKQRSTGHMECDQQESGVEALHISKCQLQPLRQKTTPSSRHAPQTSHSSHSLLKKGDSKFRP
ncbi:uncharacterized protein LOC131049705 isoform X9 [Cryptomeria japonica]|uniref:uncharacterized protein LOC131049705 isoform X9 n=1 Tax=Cryptomeria japonica TaxID=3369 RepID=UPI0027DA5AC2|nr:uncharacterized protein LOC131049705 isoform X9 [Cryptomeria japonica]XP_059073769.1 uncharacterized protein LOC131049705 isoform X9 [Cryptomeria japonica]